MDLVISESRKPWLAGTSLLIGILKPSMSHFVKMLTNLLPLYPWRLRLAALYSSAFWSPHNPGGPSFPLQKITYLLTDKCNHRGTHIPKGLIWNKALCVS